jgi:capsular exopolysaccharide synthesis family protein
VMTSPGPGEGKSTTCANLGVVLAQAEKRTLIVDCDLRRPTMHKIFSLRNMEGLTSVLIGARTLREACHEALPGLMILTTGPIPPNPAEMVGSENFARFLDDVRESFDYVLLDAPPAGPVSDPVILATQGDGVLMVLDARNSRKAALHRSIRTLETVGANLLGTIINNAEKGKDGYYGYTYERTDGWS